jgi:thiol-disulfide isomerase/thioredoxin
MLSLLAGILVLASVEAKALELKEGGRDALPALRFLDLAGNETSLASFEGKVVILNLWATWCGPCREEMPSLDRLQTRFDPDEVLVLALSLDRGAQEKVEAFLDEIGIAHLAVYRDPTFKAARTLKVPGLPATILVDKQGREAGRVLGVEAWDGPEVVEAVETLRAEPAG